MEAQEIFDTVVAHLFKQGKRAINADGNCAYRTQNGLKCAVGCLISDEEYRPEMDNGDEGTSVRDLEVQGILPLQLLPHVELLAELQSIHDDSVFLLPESEDFDLPHLRVALARVAHHFDLRY